MGDAFTYGWLKFQQNVGGIIVVLLVALGIGLALTAIVWALIAGSLSADDSGGLGLGVLILAQVAYMIYGLLFQMVIIRASLFITQGRELKTNELFITDQVGQYFVAGLLVAVVSAVATAVCLGIPILALVLWFFVQFFGFFMLDKRMNSIDSLMASFRFVNKNLGTLIAFYIGSVIAYLIGMLLCGVGILVAIPVVIIAAAFLYRQLQGEPVAP